MLVLSRDFGVTWDEKTHQLYGERVFRFLTERLDDDWFRPGGEIFMYLVGGLFDTVCVAVQQVMPGDPWVTRHYVNAVFGWLGILYVGRLGRLLSGPGTGLLAMVLLTLSPRYFGDAMNNPKDLPLAALLAAALYYLMRLEPRYPYLGWRVAVPLALSIGMAVNVRSGALIFLAYLAIALSALTIATREFSPVRLCATFLRGAGVVVAVLLLGTVFWPWAQVRPLTRPLQGMFRLSQFQWTFPVLFDGADVPASALPWDYVPRWVLLTTPPVVLLGAALSLPSPPPPADSRRTPLAGARPVGRDALSRLLHRVERGHDLRRGPAPAVHLPAPRRAGRRRLAGISREPIEEAEGRRRAGPGARPPRARPLPVAQPPEPGRLLQRPRRWALAARSAGTSSTTGETACSRGPSGRIGSREPRASASSSPARHITSCATTCGASARSTTPGKTWPRTTWRLLVLRGPRQDVLDLARRTDILYAVTTADGTPLTVVVPGPRYAEVEDALRKASPSLPRLAIP